MPTDTQTPAAIEVLTDYAGPKWSVKWEEDLVPGWEARSDVPVRVSVPPYMEDAREALQSDNPPELFHGDLRQIADFVARGQTLGVDDLLSDLVSANGDLVTDASLRASGTARIVPHGLYLGGVLNYRTDVYDALSLSVPRTWDEMRANAEAIESAESVDVRGFAVPAEEPRLGRKGGQDLLNWLYNAGGRLWRWADEHEETVELDFRSADVRAALSLMRDLAQYSPDSADLGYPDTIVEWVRGNLGQCLFPNAWLAGVAHEQDSPVATDTAVALAPLRERGLEPVTRGVARIDGAAMFREADSTGPAGNFLRYCYEGPERQAGMNIVEPMRFLPPYADVLESDVYRNAPIFQAEDGYFLRLNEQCLETIAPNHGGDRPWTTAAWYAMQEPVLQALVHGVLVEGKPMNAEIDRARTRLAARLEEGQQLAARAADR